MVRFRPCEDMTSPTRRVENVMLSMAKGRACGCSLTKVCVCDGVGRATGVILEDEAELDGLDGGIASDVVDANGGGREVVEG